MILKQKSKKQLHYLNYIYLWFQGALVCKYRYIDTTIVLTEYVMTNVVIELFEFDYCKILPGAMCNNV